MSARPRVLADVLRGVTTAFLAGATPEQLFELGKALVAAGPKIVSFLEGVDDYLHGPDDVDEQLVAAIKRAEAKNHSAAAEADLQAELRGIT